MKEITIKLPNKVKLSCDGRMVRIKHSGALSMLRRTFGEKSIPLSRITSIDFKPGRVSNGYIQFVVAGHEAIRQNRLASKMDDYTILFYPNYNKEAREFVEFVEYAMYENSVPVR